MPVTDRGTFAGRDLSGALLSGAFSFTFQETVEFSYGPFAGRAIGGSGETVFLDREVYIDAPPAAEGPGDWGMRFVGEKLGPMTQNAGVDVRPTMYVCPAGSRAYLRYFQLYNTFATPQDVSLWFAGFPQLVVQLAAGEKYEESGLWMLGPGELIEAVGPTAIADPDEPGVWLLVEGVLEVA